tara:strand:+ start:599 stop:940 length:342 start_codon:yes stop_codon:yes gene_type:complete
MTKLQELIENPPLRPTLNNILLFVPPVEETSDGGIVLYTEKEKDREKKGSAHGYVVAMGPNAFEQMYDGSVQASVGDHVFTGRYPGDIVSVDGMDDGSLRIIVDEEVRAIWPK